MTKANGTLERSININHPPSWPKRNKDDINFWQPTQKPSVYKAVLEVIRSVIECILFPTN